MKENIYNKQESKLIDNKEFASNVSSMYIDAAEKYLDREKDHKHNRN